MLETYSHPFVWWWSISSLREKPSRQAWSAQKTNYRWKVEFQYFLVIFVSRGRTSPSCSGLIHRLHLTLPTVKISSSQAHIREVMGKFQCRWEANATVSEKITFLLTQTRSENNISFSAWQLTTTKDPHSKVRTVLIRKVCRKTLYVEESCFVWSVSVCVFQGLNFLESVESEKRVQLLHQFSNVNFSRLLKAQQCCARSYCYLGLAGEYWQRNRSPSV